MKDSQHEELLASKLRLIGVLSSLVGYASTCQTTNRQEWVDTLHRYIKQAKDVIDDETHVTVTTR